ncbi:acyltransferase family protein [Burkholderia gladioli]|uniref:acyltransferase family protein n=2 Tax=Burkholderia TaxID=32008 RepID=UPI00163FE0CB|nr:acyltransferase [Burkholderia gladioli]
MTKWKYANLDAIRGLAAILIVFRHAPLLFHSPSFPQSYLAVDLFFAISGFVVANAYEARLRSGALGFLAFAKLRLIRLYPLYLIGIVLGLASHFVAMAHQHGRPLPSLFATTLFVLLSLLMLPSRATPLYLVNNPAWSLFYEIVANLAFAAIVRRAVPRILVLAMIPCAIVMLRYALDHHGIDEGWDLGKWYLALARVGFSFSAGVLMFRLRRGGPRRASAAVSLLALAAVLLMLCAKIPPRWAGPAAIAEVFVAIPLIVHAAHLVRAAGLARARLRDARPRLLRALHPPCTGAAAGLPAAGAASARRVRQARAGRLRDRHAGAGRPARPLRRRAAAGLALASRQAPARGADRLARLARSPPVGSSAAGTTTAPLPPTLTRYATVY